MRADDVKIGVMSAREAEVLRWMAAGKSDWEIGRILNISAKTVSYHVQKSKRRFGVTTRVQAVLCAVQKGMLLQEQSDFRARFR